jgi:hypothetical protein
MFQSHTREQVKEYLKTRCCSGENNNNNDNVYIFKDYGFSLKESEISKDYWNVTYIDPPFGIGLDKEENRTKSIKCDDVIRIMEVMRNTFEHYKGDKNYNIYHKTYNIQTLEKVTGVPAKMHPLHFGKWIIKDPNNRYYIVNNPYGLSLGYSKTKHDFELCFSDERTTTSINSSDGIHTYIQVVTVCEYLLKRNFTIKCTVCGKPPQISQDANGVLLLKTCNRCKDARYCSDQCQKQDTAEHKKICFIRPQIPSLSSSSSSTITNNNNNNVK